MFDMRVTYSSNVYLGRYDKHSRLVTNSPPVIDWILDCERHYVCSLYTIDCSKL